MPLLSSDSSGRGISVQNLVTGSKMEAHSVIVSKSYPVSTPSPVTPSYNKGICHTVSRHHDIEQQNDNHQSPVVNHAQFYGEYRHTLYYAYQL